MNNRGLSKEQEQELFRQYSSQFSSMALTLPDFSLFTFQGLSDLVEQDDQKIFNSSVKIVVKTMIGGVIGGIFLSVSCSRVNPFKLLTRPLWVRIPVRLILFGLPLSLAAQIGKDNQNRVETLIDKYNRRLYNFRKTKNFMHMDPNGLLFKSFIEKENKGLKR